VWIVSRPRLAVVDIVVAGGDSSFVRSMMLIEGLVLVSVIVFELAELMGESDDLMGL
jgi:hypothetical protein